MSGKFIADDLYIQPTEVIVRVAAELITERKARVHSTVLPFNAQDCNGIVSCQADFWLWCLIGEHRRNAILVNAAYATASSPLLWMIDSSRSAGPPGFFAPRSQSETRFFDTLR